MRLNCAYKLDMKELIAYKFERDVQDEVDKERERNVPKANDHTDAAV